MAFRWETFTLDVPAHRLDGPAGSIHLEPQAFDLLVYLVEHRDRVVPKAELLDSVWGDQFVSESALTTRVKQARKALGDDGRAQRYIRNIHGRGYQFVGIIEEDAAEKPASASGKTALPAAREIRLGESIAVDDEFPFVGRRAELDQIAATIASNDGAAQIYLGGAPGLGKSRLALEVLRQAADRGAIVCAGRCDEHVTSALQPVRDALGQLVVSRPADFRRWCAGLEGQILHLLPSAVGVLDGEAVAIDGYASIDVVITVLDRVAQTSPVYLLVDDLQWSDEQTRAFLSQLHRRPGAGDISTVATFRSGAPDLTETTRAWIRTQHRSPNALRLYLDELSEEAATELTTAVLGPDTTDAQELLARTSGHALFLTEALRDRNLGADAADSVIELVGSRLDRLDDNVRDLVQAGAVYGPAFPFEAIGRVAGLDPIDALDAVDRAIEAELLHETDSPARFRFSHQLIPEAIRGSLSRSASCRLHLRLSEELETAGSDDAEIAWHVLGAVPLIQVEAALDRSVSVARESLERNEFDRAVRLLQRSLTLDMQTRQKAEILVLLGESLQLAGRSIAAVPHLDEAVGLARQNGWIDILVDCALTRYGTSPFRNVRERETLALVHEALGALPDEPSVDRAKLLAKLAVFLSFDEPLDVREAMIVEAMAMTEDASVVDRMRVVEAHYIVLSCPEGADRLAEPHAELEALRAETGTYWSDAAAPESLYFLHADGDRFREVSQLDQVRQRRQPIAEWRHNTLHATMATWAGEVDVARQHCDYAAQIGEPFWGESTIALQAASHLLIDQVADEFTRSNEVYSLITEFSTSVRILPSAGLAAAGVGDSARARSIAADLVEHADRFRWFGSFMLGGNMLSCSAELGLALDHEELCQIAEQHLAPYAHLVLGLPWGPSLGAADSLARLADRRGDRDAGDAYAEQALALYDRLGAPALAERLTRLRTMDTR